MAIVGTGYSYLQEWLPHVAQHYVRTGQVDFVGLGRMVLSYHDLPADVLRGAPLDSASACAALSAIARPARATGWFRAVFRSILFIAAIRRRRC